MDADLTQAEGEDDFLVLNDEDITQEYDVDEEHPPMDDDDDDSEDFDAGKKAGEKMTDENMSMDVVYSDDTTRTEMDQGVEEVEEGEDQERMAYSDDAAVVFHQHTDSIYALDLHPLDTQLAVTGSGDDSAMIWNVQTGEIFHHLIGHQDTVGSVGFNFDGTLVATGGFDGCVKIWCVSNGQLLQTLEGPSQEVEWIHWHSKGNVLLAGSADATAWMWAATSGECMHVLAGHEDGVSCGSFTGSGKMAVTGSVDGTVRLWDPKTGKCVHVFRGHEFHEGPISTVKCHPSQPICLTGSQDGTAKLIHIQSKRILATFAHGVRESRSGTIADNAETTTNSIESVGFSRNHPWCATACLDGELRIWDMSTNQCRHVCRQEEGITKLKWHPTEPTVFTTSVDGTVQAWDARNGQCIRIFRGHKDMVLDLCVTLQTVVSVSDDHTARTFLI